jgi:site-specific recombinase XerD
MMRLTEAVSIVSKGKDDELFLRSYIAGEYPKTIRALRFIDQNNLAPNPRKGFNLVKRENKKSVFLYYLRYYHHGQMLPSTWKTHTNNLEEAERFARENRTRLIERYLRSHDRKMFTLFEQFFQPESDFLACEEKRNRQLSSRCRKEYHAVIHAKFIPFLERRNIAGFDEITPLVLSDFQDSLLTGGVKPQTVNNNLKAVKRICMYLARKGMIRENPCDHLRGIPVHQNDKTVRGCYEVEKLKGVFNKRWKDEVSYLLCLLVYTTGMRNSEIKRFKMADVISIGGCRFIDIKESKTPSGVRMVPLHDFVYRKLSAYGSKRDPASPLFEVHNFGFIKANACLARKLRISESELRTERITLYSGRHFWKTLLNSEGLGEDIEEIFMGHKVSGNIAKQYNHRDKQGKKLITNKANHVFAILDRCLFGSSYRTE